MGDDFGTGTYLRVYQAQGMVSVQAHCSMDRAMVLMKQRAIDRVGTLDELAAMILDGSVRIT